MLVFIPSDQFLASVGCYLLEANGGTLRGSGLDLMRGFGGLFMSQRKTQHGVPTDGRSHVSIGDFFWGVDS